MESFSTSSFVARAQSGPFNHLSIRPGTSALAASRTSQNADRIKHGPIISDITSPDDLKDFVTKDDRVGVIKVYADWCKTCKQFDLRFRKVASQWGEMNGSDGEYEFSNSVRFAQMEYGANEEICKLLNATRVPFILVYQRKAGKLAGFKCPPSKIQMLIDILHKNVEKVAPVAPLTLTTVATVLHKNVDKVAPVAPLTTVATADDVDKVSPVAPLTTVADKVAPVAPLTTVTTADDGLEPVMMEENELKLIMGSEMDVEMDFEKALTEGSALLDSIVGELQKQEEKVPSDSSMSSFEEFCHKSANP